MTDSTPKIGKIFIGGLSYETTDDKLRAYFGAYGTVTDAVVMKDPISRRSRGFGFITYADPACVDRALAQPNHVLDNRRVEAKRAVPRAESNRDTSSISTRGNVSAGSSVTSASAVGATKKIFVGGLHYETKDADFKKYFQHFGKVVSAEVMFNRETNKSRGFGFVIFETEASVELVLQDKTHAIDGKSVEVKRAVPRTDAPPTTTGSVRSVSNRGGSFSGQSSDHELLSPRSTPASPKSTSSRHHLSSFGSLDGHHHHHHAPASSMGGYAAAVRYGNRAPAMFESSSATPSLVDGLETLSLHDDDAKDDELPGSMLHGWTKGGPYEGHYPPHPAHHGYPHQMQPPHWQHWQPPPPDHAPPPPPSDGPTLFGMFSNGSSPDVKPWDAPGAAPYEATPGFGGFGLHGRGFMPRGFGMDNANGTAYPPLLPADLGEPDLDGAFGAFSMPDMDETTRKPPVYQHEEYAAYR